MPYLLCAALNCRLNFPLRRMWLLVMVLNSSYSFYWDVEQDWDMPWLTQYGKRSWCRRMHPLSAASHISTDNLSMPRSPGDPRCSVTGELKALSLAAL
jgi:hypothetical protein